MPYYLSLNPDKIEVEDTCESYYMLYHEFFEEIHKYPDHWIETQYIINCITDNVQGDDIHLYARKYQNNLLGQIGVDLYINPTDIANASDSIIPFLNFSNNFHEHVNLKTVNSDNLK